MKVDIIQTAFSGGEFGPSLYGRTDISQYQNACEIIENFLIRPYGSAISAPGSVYVATVSDSTLKTRLMKFVFNRSDAYIIEAGDLYMRFYTNRGQVSTTGTTGTEDLSSFSANLVAQWKMNDNSNSTLVIDTVGSHSGTASTLTSTLHDTGKVGTGSFNMAGLYSIEIPHSSAFNFSETAGTNPFSILAWVYVNPTGSVQHIVSKRDTNKQEWGLSIRETGKLLFFAYDESHASQVSIQTNSDLSTGWHSVFMTYDGRGGAAAYDGMNLYVDGAIVSDVTRSAVGTYANMVANNAVITIGARLATTFNQYFSDKLDNIAIFNKQLSSTEIAGLYPTTSYQLTTPYVASDLEEVQYTQLNDVIWLTHKDRVPQQLTRVSSQEWTIANFDFKGGPFLDDNTDTSILLTPSATGGTINVTVSPTNSNLFTVSGTTLGHHNSYWMIGGLAQTNSTTGLEEVGYVKITNVVNSYTATATVIKNLKSTSATSIWAEGAWSAVRGYPSHVIFHDSRLWFGRTNYEPQKIWGSKIYEYDNFALDTQDDDDAINLSLVSNEANELQWLASTKNLLSGTYGGGFVISSGGDDVSITPDNAHSNEEIGIGSASIAPKRIGQFLYFLQRFQKVLRELFFSWDLDTYKATDRTILSPHILGDGAIDMDVQINPSPGLYCVRTDGTLAILTREPDQEFAAWSRRTTSGTYTSIAVIPSQSADYDEPWAIVERWVNGSQKKYVEYFENPVPPSRQDLCIYLDSALTFNAYSSTSTSNVTISLSASSGSVTLTSSSAYFNGGMIGKRIRAIDANGTKLGEGQITATASTLSITLSITSTFNSLSYSAGRWGVSVSSISGLSHLEAKTVGVLADGTTESLTRTVASGVVTLGSNYFVVHVGLSYNQIIKTLPKEAGAQRGTAQGKLQRINEVAFKVNRSYMGFQYGLDADNLDTLTSVDSTLTQSLSTGTFGNYPFRGGYQRGTPIYIKSSNPLPIELLNIIATIDTQEK